MADMYTANRKVPGYYTDAPKVGEPFPFYITGRPVPFQTGKIKAVKIQIIDEDGFKYEIIDNGENNGKKK
jgi:hypothetical protein